MQTHICIEFLKEIFLKFTQYARKFDIIKHSNITVYYLDQLKTRMGLKKNLFPMSCVCLFQVIVEIKILLPAHT